MPCEQSGALISVDRCAVDPDAVHRHIVRWSQHPLYRGLSDGADSPTRSSARGSPRYGLSVAERCGSLHSARIGPRPEDSGPRTAGGVVRARARTMAPAPSAIAANPPKTVRVPTRCLRNAIPFAPSPRACAAVNRGAEQPRVQSSWPWCNGVLLLCTLPLPEGLSLAYAVPPSTAPVGPPFAHGSIPLCSSPTRGGMNPPALAFGDNG